MSEFTPFPIEKYRDLFIFGEPFETPYGQANFISYKDFNMNVQKLSLLTQNILHIYYMYYSHLKDSHQLTPEIERELDAIKNMTLRTFVLDSESYANAYLTAFSLVFNHGEPLEEEQIETIFQDDDTFMDARNIVLEMNLLKEETVSPNPEIQYFLDKKKEISTKESLKPSDYLTSISVACGISLYEINSYSTYMVFATYSRIAQMKNYDTAVLYSTVTDKVTIEDWNKHIDFFKEEDSGMDRNKLNQYRNMLS